MSHAEPAEPEDESSPEELIFDEAIKSEEAENKRDILQKIDKKQDYYKAELKKTSDEKKVGTIKAAQERLEELKLKIENQIKEEK